MVKLVYCICRTSPEWRASTADEANFLDPTRSAYFGSEERQIL